MYLFKAKVGAFQGVNLSDRGCPFNPLHLPTCSDAVFLLFITKIVACCCQHTSSPTLSRTGLGESLPEKLRKPAQLFEACSILWLAADPFDSHYIAPVQSISILPSLSSHMARVVETVSTYTCLIHQIIVPIPVQSFGIHQTLLHPILQN